MNESNIATVRILDDGRKVRVLEDGTFAPVISTTDWARVRAMSEEEIEANALSDPDNPPMSDEELSRMRWSLNPRAIRRRMNLTQEQFAERFQIPIGTLRDWEQERKEPERTAKILMRIISCRPDAVDESLCGWSAAD